MRRFTLPLLGIAAAAAVVVPVAAAPAASSVKVTLRDFSVTPARTSASAGKVTFVVKNAAPMEHEFYVIKTARKAANLPVKGDEASEKGTVGDIEGIGAGKTKSVSINLKPGHYALICNKPGHYKLGMHADFTVR